MMSREDRRILDRFAAQVREATPLVAIWAFGSRARGSADAESDLDLCVVLPAVTRELRERIYGIAWEIGFERDRVISTLVTTRRGLEQGPFGAQPVLRTIEREGIPV